MRDGACGQADVGGSPNATMMRMMERFIRARPFRFEYGGVQKLPASQNRQCLAFASQSDMAPTGGKKRRLLDFLAMGKLPRPDQMMRQLRAGAGAHAFDGVADGV